ncbi:hypothetical protein FQN52_002430 [Onygenales sp. PD_12]|nr:hypothetical protein FQN52_002430 [Onygenales sp. PD_12]
MHPTRPSKKEITCYYWNSGKCKYSADSCLYAHSITGVVAEQPTRSSKSEPKPDRNNIVDLISLVDCDDIAAPTATSTPGTQARSLSSDDSFGFGSSDELDYPKLTKTFYKAVQSGRGYAYIQAMLDKHTSRSVREALSETKDGESAIFAAVKRGVTDIINLLVEKGANPNATESSSGVPLLAFAVLQDSDITVVQTLLSLGADPRSIPRDIWDPEVTYKDSLGWCSNSQRVSLLTRMNSHLQYHLQTAYKLDPPSQKNRQVAQLLGTKALLHAPYTMVGQAYAIDKVENYMTSHLMFRADRPLVLAFVGPPNHGQAELAAKIGTMGSLKRVVERAKALNKRINIDHMSGDSSSHELEVVYIDNLDKIGCSNLITLLDGSPQGPKSNTAIDNSNIIYVLSVTDGENTIIDFHNKHRAEGQTPGVGQAYWDKLDTDLKKDLVKGYGTLLTSHIDAVIPFLPYTKGETIALASKYIHDLRSRLAETSTPTLLSRNTTKARFSLELELDDEPQICSTIAAHGYDMTLGARSIQQEVVSKIQVTAAERYARLDVDSDEEGSVDDVFGGEGQGIVRKIRAKVMVKRGRGQWGKDGGQADALSSYPLLQTPEEISCQLPASRLQPHISEFAMGFHYTDTLEKHNWVGGGLDAYIYHVTPTIVVKTVRRDRTPEEQVAEHPFVKEIEFFKKLNDCPDRSLNIVECFLILPDHLFLSYCTHKTLAARFYERQEREGSNAFRGRLVRVKETEDPVLIARWIQQLSSALEFIERMGYCHNDLHASNCLLDQNLNLKLADFGRATTIGQFLEGVLPPRARPILAGPLRGSYGLCSARTEQFALGTLLYFMVYGHEPYDYDYEALTPAEWDRRFWELEFPELNRHAVFDGLVAACWHNVYPTMALLAYDFERKTRDIGSSDAEEYYVSINSAAETKTCKELVRRGLLGPELALRFQPAWRIYLHAIVQRCMSIWQFFRGRIFRIRS